MDLLTILFLGLIGWYTWSLLSAMLSPDDDQPRRTWAAEERDGDEGDEWDDDDLDAQQWDGDDEGDGGE